MAVACIHTAWPLFFPVLLSFRAAKDACLDLRFVYRGNGWLHLVSVTHQNALCLGFKFSPLTQKQRTYLRSSVEDNLQLQAMSAKPTNQGPSYSVGTSEACQSRYQILCLFLWYMIPVTFRPFSFRAVFQKHPLFTCTCYLFSFLHPHYNKIISSNGQPVSQVYGVLVNPKCKRLNIRLKNVGS